jgi:hypothetical protein
MRVPSWRSAKRRFAAGKRALFALLFSSWMVLPALAQEHAPTYDTLVIVDFPSLACRAFWPTLKSTLQNSETSRLLPGNVVWMRREEFRAGMEFREGYQVFLRGDCDNVPPSFGQHEPRGPLGWVLLVDHQIQPFVYVDCDRVAQTLARELRGKATSERRQFLARAISRVVAHEMTHIATQSSLHSASGLQKARVTPLDLLEYSVD